MGKVKIDVKGKLRDCAEFCGNVGNYFERCRDIEFKRKFNYNPKTDKMKMSFFVKLLEYDEDDDENG